MHLSEVCYLCFVFAALLDELFNLSDKYCFSCMFIATMKCFRVCYKYVLTVHLESCLILYRNGLELFLKIFLHLPIHSVITVAYVAYIPLSHGPLWIG